MPRRGQLDDNEGEPAPAPLALPPSAALVPIDPAESATMRSCRCLLEALEPPSTRGNNFAKGTKWSPDGAVALTVHDDASVRVCPVPDEAIEGVQPEDGEKRPAPLVASSLVHEGGPISDFCFFPGFRWDCPATCCYITSSQDHPVHLRNALDGSLCNTYRPFNNVDEVCHAFSLCFSSDGSKIVAGFPQCLRIFDVQRPGRQAEDWVLSTRKGKGQKGIIGALASSPLSPGLYAAGSYSRSVCLYHDGSRGTPLAWLADVEPEHEMGGVTQLAWAGEWMLLSGHRRDRWLRVWDLRMAGDDREGRSQGHSRSLLHRFPRSCQTHQRFLFSVRGDHLATGDDSGAMLLYSLSALGERGRVPRAHSRPCTAAMLHPRLDALLSCSGGRLFPNYDVESPVVSPPSSPQGGPLSPPQKRRRRSGRRRGRSWSSRTRSPAAETTQEELGHAEPGLPDNSVRVWRLDWALPLS